MYATARMGEWLICIPEIPGMLEHVSFTINLPVTTLVKQLEHLDGWRNMVGQTNFQVDLNHDKRVVKTAFVCCCCHNIRRTLF